MTDVLPGALPSVILNPKSCHLPEVSHRSPCRGCCLPEALGPISPRFGRHEDGSALRCLFPAEHRKMLPPVAGRATMSWGDQKRGFGPLGCSPAVPNHSSPLLGTTAGGGARILTGTGGDPHMHSPPCFTMAFPPFDKKFSCSFLPAGQAGFPSSAPPLLLWAGSWEGRARVSAVRSNRS